MSGPPTLIPRRFLFLVFLAVIVTRIPFLVTGYGNDADAWLVANSAATLWHSGMYMESRLPGFPLHEILSAPFVALGGAPLSNAATLAATLCALLIWWRIAREHTQYPRLVLIAFAFAPVVWQNSAVTLDYMWSLAALLFALFSVMKDRFLLAGIMAGAAAGFRLPNIAAVVPLIVFLALREGRKSRLLVFGITVAVVSAIFYLPLLVTYGPAEWVNATRLDMGDVHPDIPERLSAFVYRTVYSIGLLTALLVGHLAWKNRLVLHAALRDRDSVACMSLAALATFLLLFLWLPLERAYLLPALPFLLLLLDRMTTQNNMLLFTGLLVLSGLINIDIVQAENRRAFGINVHSGMVIEELTNRNTMLRERARYASLAFGGKSIIITAAGPSFWMENTHVEPASDPLLHNLKYSSGHFRITQRKGDPSTVHVAFLLRHELNMVRRAGYRVFCSRKAVGALERTAGNSPESEGITLIDF